jgi:ubiquinone biosynthesis protein
MMMRVIAMSEGLGLKLDPEFHYLDFVSPIIREHWQSARSAGASVVRLGRAAADATELVLELPRRTGRLLGRLERGELEVNIRHEGLEKLAGELQGMTNRLALAMILAASVVALGVALGFQGAAGFGPFLRWLFGLGFVFSLAFGAWVVGSIWRSRKR